MSFLLIWLGGSFLVGLLASSRGRSAILAFLLALILSPLLIGLLYLILGQSKRAVRKRIFQEERLRMEARQQLESQSPQRR